MDRFTAIMAIAFSVVGIIYLLWKIKVIKEFNYLGKEIEKEV